MADDMASASPQADADTTDAYECEHVGCPNGCTTRAGLCATCARDLDTAMMGRPLPTSHRGTSAETEARPTPEHRPDLSLAPPPALGEGLLRRVLRVLCPLCKPGHVLDNGRVWALCGAQRLIVENGFGEYEIAAVIQSTPTPADERPEES